METMNLKQQLEELLSAENPRKVTGIFNPSGRTGRIEFAANAPLRWAAPTPDATVRLELQSIDGGWFSVDFVKSGDNYVSLTATGELPKDECPWREFSKSSEVPADVWDFDSITVNGTAFTVATTKRKLVVEIKIETGGVPDFDSYRTKAGGKKLSECPLKKGTYRSIKEVTE